MQECGGISDGSHVKTSNTLVVLARSKNRLHEILKMLHADLLRIAVMTTFGMLAEMRSSKQHQKEKRAKHTRQIGHRISAKGNYGT